jgi:long-subunit acyl-CoA synthetase (AMP-forming)
VFAAQDKSKPIAIIVPVEATLTKLAAANGIKGESLEEMVTDEKLNGIVLKEVQKAGRESGLAGIEIIDGIVMADEEWTPQNVSGAKGDYEKYADYRRVSSHQLKRFKGRKFNNGSKRRSRRLTEADCTPMYNSKRRLCSYLH